MLPLTRFAVCTASLLVVFAAAGLAHEGATGVAKDRMDLMGDMSQSMKSIAKRLRANRDLPAIAADADRVSKDSPHIADLFPPGSDKGVTDAKPAIWQKWGEFVGNAKKLGEETAKLSSVAATGDARAISDQYRTVTKVCIACHDTFRRGRADKL
jgi:cytochrome c556